MPVLRTNVNPQQKVCCRLALTLAVISLASAQDEEASGMPTWQDKIAKGFVPYHQLTVEDFRIDDQAHPESGFWVRPFMHPHWKYILKRNGDWWYAYVDPWIIFSGFDKNESTRKSKFREMKRSLPYAQAYLDLHEIHARQLAALKPGELPSGRGATQQEAGAALHQSLEAFLKEKYQPLQSETEVFVKATKYGANEKKVRELAKEIRKRLDTIPAPTGSAYDSTTTAPASSPAPQPSGTPAK
jgi:hypothetical protein